jgi:hypothetical protein
MVKKSLEVKKLFIQKTVIERVIDCETVIEFQHQFAVRVRDKR